MVVVATNFATNNTSIVAARSHICKPYDYIPGSRYDTPIYWLLYDDQGRNI